MYSIRVATISDTSSLARAHLRAWQSAYRGILTECVLRGVTLEYLEQLWRERFSRGAPGLWVATRGDDVLGFASFGPSMDADVALSAGAIYGLYVVPEAQGTGMGQALWEHASESLRAHGFAEVHLWVLEENARARRFYERQGGRLDAQSRRDKELHGIPVAQVRYRWT